MCDDEVVSEATVEKVLETIDKQLAVKALCQSLIEPSCSFVQSIRKFERILKLFKFRGKYFKTPVLDLLHARKVSFYNMREILTINFHS